MLRRAGADQQFLTRLWRAGRRKDILRRRLCPHCRQRMAQVPSRVAGAELALDVCPTCACVWFDPAEYARLPKELIRPEPSEKDLPLAARRELALSRVKRIQEEADAQEAKQGPAEPWQWLPAVLGLPVEIDAPGLRRLPWVTWLTALACVGVLGVTFWQAPTREALQRFFEEWGFVPDRMWQHGGLAMITSFFLHGGVWHLVGNMYFLLIFGDNVEDRLGPALFVLMLAAGHGAGMLLHGLYEPHTNLPCVGASAGISAVVAFYAVMYPRVRIGFFWRIFLFFRWFTIPAFWALVLFTLFQLIGAMGQIHGMSGVSYLAHLGGLAAGFAFVAGCKWRQRIQRGGKLNAKPS